MALSSPMARLRQIDGEEQARGAFNGAPSPRALDCRRGKFGVQPASLPHIAWRGGEPTVKLQFEVRPQTHIKPRRLCLRRGEPHHEEGQQ